MGRRTQGLVALLLVFLLAPVGAEEVPAQKPEAPPAAPHNPDWFAARGRSVLEPLIRTVAKSPPMGPFADAVHFTLGADTITIARALLDDPEEDTAVRAAAARALGALGPRAKTEVDRLVALVANKDEDTAVRNAAAHALGRLGRHAAAALPTLLTYARSNETAKETATQQTDGDASLLALGAIVRDLSLHEHQLPARNEKVAAAVARGLDWLARHQDDDGKWDPAEFDRHAPPDDRNDRTGGRSGRGKPGYATGVTGLVLLAFVQAGPPERYALAVHRAGRFLVGQQAADGLIGPGKPLHRHYNHTIALWALAETWRRTRDPLYREAVRKGVAYLQGARNKNAAWRYKPGDGNNDTSITAWAAYALRAAETAGLAVDPEAYKGALAWTNKMTHKTTGIAGYTTMGGLSARPSGMTGKYPAARTRSTTAAAVGIRLAAGQTYGRNELLRKGLWECAKLPPIWDVAGGRCDPYYWFHATLAMTHTRCRASAEWNTKLLSAVLRNQYKKQAGWRSGSWEPSGPWQHDGGRVYTAAILTLCLQCVNQRVTPLSVPVASQKSCQEAAQFLQQIQTDDRQPEERREAARRALVGLG